MQRKRDQTQHILGFYIDGLSAEKQFDCLKKAGFLDILSQCAAINANFDTFLADIDRVAKAQKIRSKFLACLFVYLFTKLILN